MTTEYSDVCAGIVLFNPDIDRLKSVVGAISGQVKEVVLVDNGSVNNRSITAVLANYMNVSLITNTENEGIAKALNQICKYGKDNGYQWGLTLDQDTVCPGNLIEELYKHTNNAIHGIVCPAVHYEGVNMESPSVNTNGEYVYACMTSASLTRLEAWEKVGGFNEGYFIDFVDNEFCMKLKQEGYKVYRTNHSAISHQLGESREVRFLWYKSVGTIHSSLRCYYMMRNNVLFIRQYGKELNVLKEYSKVAYIAYRQLLYSQQKMNDLIYIAKGLKDGFKGKTGKYEA